ncbi:MAG: hypothetical protein ACKVTZ_15655 [Bacteroidia bacterium]
MKHITFLFLLVTALPTSAQHLIKFRPQSLIFQNIALNYEYFFKKNTSFQIGLTYMLKHSIPRPFESFSLGVDAQMTREKALVQAWGLSITPELRFYHRTTEDDQKPRLYFSPYFRYFHYFFQAKGGGELLDEFFLPRASYKYKGEGQTWAMKTGLQIGALFPITKHLKLDLVGGLNMGVKTVQMKTTFEEVVNMTESELLGFVPNIASNFGDAVVRNLGNQKMLLQTKRVNIATRAALEMCYQF